MSKPLEIVIQQGKSFSQVLRWETEPIVYKAITGVTQTAPVRITAPAHGLTEGWRAAVVSVKGMLPINAETLPPKDKDFRQAHVIDADNIEFNEVNASGFKPYAGSGYLQYNTPTDLTGYEARMSIKDKIGGTELLRLDTTNGRIDLDNVAKTITIAISAADTAAITWKKGVFDLEAVSPSGIVKLLLAGTVVVAREVTTT